MAVSELFTVSGVNLNHASADVYIDQIESYSLNPNLTNLLLSGAGEADASFVATQLTAPVISVTTSQVDTVLDIVGIDGEQIKSDATYTSVDCYLASMAEGAVRTAGANHIKMTINEGMWIPRTVRASQAGGPATITIDLIVTYDGTNAPIIFASSQSLPAVASAGEAFVIGKGSVNGTALAGMQDLTVDFGISEIVMSGDGDYAPTFVAIMDRQPRISATTNKATFLTTALITGVAQSATDSVFYLRKATEGGTRVADATAEHISFTVDEGIIQVGNTTYSQGQPVAQAFDIVPTYDGTNAVIVLSTVAAIT